MDALRLQYKALSKAGRGMRSLFSRAPKSAEVFDRAVRLMRRKLLGRITHSGGANPSISIDFHPGSAAVKLTAPADGELLVTIAPRALGPGYVRHVLELLDGILEEIDFVWDAQDEGYASGRDFAALQQVFVSWLARQLPEILEGTASKQLGIPQEPQLEIDAALLTPMGPRSRAWCEQVLGGGEAATEAARDLWPMWEAATPAALSLARGLWFLWVEVPWRLPMGELEEGVMKQAHRDLAAAHKADRTLAMPWAEWAELLDYLDLDDEVSDEVRQQGAAENGAIGYRRHPARFALTTGWSVRLTPNFSDSWVDEGAAMLASDGDRSVRCSCAESEGDSASEILAKIPMHGEVLARHDEGGYQGRVEGRDDEVHGVRLITAIMATAGSAAVLSAVLRSGNNDDEWAIEAWRTLRRSEGAAPEQAQ